MAGVTTRRAQKQLGIDRVARAQRRRQEIYATQNSRMTLLTYLLFSQAPSVLKSMAIVLPPLRRRTLSEPVGVEEGGDHLLLVRRVLELADEKRHAGGARDAILSLVHAGQKEARDVPHLVVPLILIIDLEEERAFVERWLLVFVRFVSSLYAVAPSPPPFQAVLICF